MNALATRVSILLSVALALSAGDLPKLSSVQWHADLRYFQRELERRHKNAFHFTSRENFEAAVADLDRRLDSLEPDAIYVGLARLAASIGDAHTNIGVPLGTSGAYPIRVRQFVRQFVRGLLPDHRIAVAAQNQDRVRDLRQDRA